MSSYLYFQIGLLARLSSPEPREKESKKVKTQTAQELADMIRGIFNILLFFLNACSFNWIIKLEMLA